MELEPGTYLSNLIIRQPNNRIYWVCLCSGWDMPIIYEKYDVNIIGSLYTKEGALLVLRNLLANPEHKCLIIVDKNILGQNNIGCKGLNFLHRIFFENIIDTTYDLKKLLENIIVFYVKNDQIEINMCGKIDVIKDPFEKIFEIIDNLDLTKINRKKIIIKPEPTEIISYCPNNYIGTTIRGENLFDAWFQTLYHIYKFGLSNKDNLHEYHSIHWNFPVDNLENTLDDYLKIITQEDIRQMISLDKRSLEDYTRIMNENIVVDTSSYTYGNRLACFKEKIKSELHKNYKTTRHAYATTIKYDINDKQPPCLIYVQLLYDNVNQKMNLYAVFRSHDIFRAALANAYALCMMLKKYCEPENIPIGRIEITSISAHIYQNNLNDVKLFINCLSTQMKNIIHYDPCGNCIITKNNNNYVFELFEPKENKLICTITGTPKDIFSSIIKNKIITDIEHLTYIFEQLF